MTIAPGKGLSSKVRCAGHPRREGRRAAASCRSAGGRTWARGSSPGAPAAQRPHSPRLRPGGRHQSPAPLGLSACAARPDLRPSLVSVGVRGAGTPAAKFMGCGDQPRVFGCRDADRGALPEQRNAGDGCARRGPRRRVLARGVGAGDERGPRGPGPRWGDVGTGRPAGRPPLPSLPEPWSARRRCRPFRRDSVWLSRPRKPKRRLPAPSRWRPCSVSCPDKCMHATI